MDKETKRAILGLAVSIASGIGACWLFVRVASDTPLGAYMLSGWRPGLLTSFLAAWVALPGAVAIALLDRKVVDCKSKIARLMNAIQKATDANKISNYHLGEAQKEIVNLKANIQQLAEGITQKDASIAEQKKLVAEKIALAEKAKAVIDSQDAEIADLTEKLEKAKPLIEKYKKLMAYKI